MKYKRVSFQIVCTDKTLKQSYWPLIVFLAFCCFCQKTSALTLDEYIRKIPEYIDFLPEGAKREEASERLKFYAFFLLRGFQLLQSNEIWANEWLRQLCQWIAMHPDEAIINRIVEWFKSKGVAFFSNEVELYLTTLTQAENLTVGAADFLRRIFVFSVDLRDGKPQAVLHGSRALQAHLTHLYGEAEGVEANDWDFKVREGSFFSLLNTLKLPKTTIEELLRRSQQSQGDPYYFNAYFEGYILSMCYRRNHDNDGWVLGLKYKEDYEGGGQFKTVINLDFFFTNDLPESTFISFKPIGYVLASKLQGVLEALYYSMHAQSHFIGKYRSRLNYWQQLEQKYHSLEDQTELRDRLTKYSVQSEAELLTDVHMPVLFEQIRYSNRQEDVLSDMPKSEERYSQTGTVIKRALYEAEKKVLIERHHFRLKETVKFNRMWASAFKPKLGPMSYCFKKLVEEIGCDWRFQRELEASHFSKYINLFGNKEDEELKEDFHRYLCLKQKTLVQYLRFILKEFGLDNGSRFNFSELALPYCGPFVLIFGFIAKTLSIEMQIGAIVQQNILATLPEEGLSEHTKEVMQDEVRPLTSISILYAALYGYSVDLKLCQESDPVRVFAFKKGLSQLSRHFKYGGFVS